MKHVTKSQNQTLALGEKIAAQLPFQAAIELIGDVGSGKTTLIKGLARGLGVKEIVQSPSYTIFARYDAGARGLHHYDFYRLKEPGLTSFDVAESVDEPGVVTVVEWADSVREVLPKKRIIIRITPRLKNEREIEITGLEI